MTMHTQGHRVALVTGASRGLGLALTTQLLQRGWRVVVDARDPAGLAQATRRLPHPEAVEAIAGDVADPVHRAALTGAVAAAGRLDLLVNNASILGPSPQPRLADYPLDVLAQVYAVNTIAPLALVQAVLPYLAPTGGASSTSRRTRRSRRTKAGAGTAPRRRHSTN
jgi:NAD(P)-dependent dehydrogenase (short-subunit alcohol dehydrogenase family)